MLSFEVSLIQSDASENVPSGYNLVKRITKLCKAQAEQHTMPVVAAEVDVVDGAVGQDMPEQQNMPDIAAEDELAQAVDQLVDAVAQDNPTNELNYNVSKLIDEAALELVTAPLGGFL